MENRIMQKILVHTLFLLGLAVASCGAVSVASAEAPPPYIYKWGTYGTGPGQFGAVSPQRIAFGPNGNLYVGDFGNGRVQIFSPTGVFLGQFGSPGSSDGQFQGPLQIAFSPLGEVYVADEQNYRIQKFSSTGAFLLKWGSYG